MTQRMIRTIAIAAIINDNVSSTSRPDNDNNRDDEEPIDWALAGDGRPSGGADPGPNGEGKAMTFRRHFLRL